MFQQNINYHCFKTTINFMFELTSPICVFLSPVYRMYMPIHHCVMLTTSHFIVNGNFNTGMPFSQPNFIWTAKIIDKKVRILTSYNKLVSFVFQIETKSDYMYLHVVCCAQILHICYFRVQSHSCIFQCCVGIYFPCSALIIQSAGWLKHFPSNINY